MNWPTSQDYNEAIQNPASSFADPDLKTGEVALNAIGLPVPRSGNFADVYEYKTKDGKKWALKLFTRKVAGLQERYAKIDEHLLKAKFPFTVGFKYLAEGIRIRGQWFPVLKMEWVEGFTLNEFVRDNAGKPQYLHALLQMWGKLTALLRDADFAHADLQHGNVLLVPATSGSKLGLRLIDYDGMWVPALAETHSGEVGHPNFQHPLRLKDRLYNADVDRFPHLVIAAALRATLIGGRPFWDKWDNGDNLLFKETDLRDPANSPVFKALWNLNDPVLCMLVGKLALASKEPLRKTPWLDDLLLTDEGKQLTEGEEAKVIQLLGVKPHFTAAKTGSREQPALQQEYNAFAFEEDVPSPSSKSLTKSVDKSSKHKAVVLRDDNKGKKKGPSKEEKKSKLPLLIGGGVAALLAIVGIIIAASGGKPTPTQVAKGDTEEKKIVTPKKDDTEDPKIIKKDPEVIGKKDPEVLVKKDPEIVVKKDPKVIVKKDLPTGTLAQPERVWKNTLAVNFNSLTFSDDGAKFYRTLGKDLRTIHVHATTDPQPPRASIPFPSGALSLQHGPNGLLAITTLENRLALFDPTTREVRWSHELADRSNNCPFAEDIDAILALVPGGKLEVLSLVDGKTLQTHDLPQGVDTRFVDCTPDGKTIAIFTLNGEIYAKTAGEPAFKSIFKVMGTAVRKVVLSPDGAFAAKSANNKIHILETATGKEHRLLPGHNGEIRVIQFTNDGRYLLSLSKDKTLRVWDIEAGKLLHNIDLDGEGKSMAMSPDAQSVLVATENDVSLQMFRLAYERTAVVKKDPVDDPNAAVKELWNVPALSGALSFNRDGSKLAIANGPTIRLHDVKDGSSLPSLTLEQFPQRSVICADGAVVASSFMGAARKVYVWDPQTGKDRFQIEGDEPANPFFNVAHKAETIHVALRSGAIGAFSLKDGKKLDNLTVGVSGILSISSTDDGEAILAATGGGDVYFRSAKGQPFRKLLTVTRTGTLPVFLRLSPDGKHFVHYVGGKAILVYETVTGRQIATLEGHTNTVDAAVFTPDSRRILSVGDETLRIWDVTAAKQIKQIKLFSEGPMRHLAISDNGQFAAATGSSARGYRLTLLDISKLEGGTAIVKLPDPEPKPKEIVKKDPPEVPPMPKSIDELTEVWKGTAGTFLTSLSFSKDGARLATSVQSSDASLLDARNGSIADRRKVTDGQVSAITFAGNDWLFIVDRDRKVFVWDLKNKAKSTAIDAQVTYAQQFAVAADKDVIYLPIQRGEIGMYSLKDLKKTGAIPIATQSEIQWLSTTADGENIVAATTGGEVFARTKGENAFKLLTTFPGGGHRRVAIASDGKTFAYSMNKEPIRILDIADGKELKVLEGHTGELLAIQFLDAKTLVSAARDDTLRVWNVDAGKQAHEIKPTVGLVLAMAVSSDGKAVAVGGPGGTQLWRVGNDGGTVIAKKDPDPMPKMVDPKKEMKVEPKAVVLKEELVKTSAALSDEVVSVSYSFDGKRLNVATKRGVMHVLDPITLEETTKYAMLDAEVKAAVAAPKLLGPTTTPREWIYILDANRHLRVYDAEKKVLTKADVAIDNVGFGSSQILVAPDIKTLIFMARQGFGAVSYWDLKTATDTGPAVLMRSPFQRSAHWVTYSYDNKYGAAISSSKLLVWNQRTGADIRQGDCRDGQRVVLVPDANIVVVTGRRFGGGRFAHYFTAWNFVTGKELWDKEVTGECQSLVAIPKSNRILTSTTTEITLRDGLTGEELLKWKPTDSSTNLTVSPDGKYLVTNGEQGSQVKLWLLPAATTGKKP